MKRIAVVDDVPDNLEILMQMLRLGGFAAEGFGDPEAVLDPAVLANLDLLMLDIAMPNITGNELFHRVRAIDPTIPMVAISANVYPEDIARAKETGFLAFFKKPIDDWEGLCDQVRQLVR